MFTIGKIVLIGTCLLGAAAGADAHIQNLQSKNMMFNDGSIGNCIVAAYDGEQNRPGITASTALEIALNNAGVNEKDTHDCAVEGCYNDELQMDVYSVTFTVDNQGWKYLIDYHNGNILKVDTFASNQLIKESYDYEDRS